MIILVLFAARRIGTARVGRLFGPVMIVWFLTLAVAGIGGIVAEPEALYADLGHFGRSAISRAWLVLVFPACTLSYFGQGALILADRVRTAPSARRSSSWCRRGP